MTAKRAVNTNDRECRMPQTRTTAPDRQSIVIGGRQCFGMTHIGLARQTNADRYLIHALRHDEVLLALADGLGPTPAAAHAADSIHARFAAIADIAPGHERDTLDRIAREADLALWAESQRDADLDGTGSTLVAVLLRGRQAYWVHVGDSRLYLFRDAVIRQVTRDQTLARFLVAENEITLEEAAVHYSRHVMDQYIGCGFAEPETGVLALLPSDLLVLTSDGLHKQISTETLRRVLDRRANLADTGHALVEAALAVGGADNITVVLARP